MTGGPKGVFSLCMNSVTEATAKCKPKKEIRHCCLISSPVGSRRVLGVCLPEHWDCKLETYSGRVSVPLVSSCRERNGPCQGTIRRPNES